ncbi:hypothetical protein [Nonomuraea typhae]|uniref:hypothetical protein n=1 Tax=Nonomuraea typhae TaxID=2603600 RepID=UPI0012F89B2C|nr:hypothetical protein [Nonomuraea typhae]
MVFVVCAVVSTAGCGLFQVTFRAEAGAVREVSGIGRVVEKTFVDPIYRNTIQIDDILVMDVGASSHEEGMAVARDRLAKAGWVPGVEREQGISLDSARWKDTPLSVAPYEPEAVRSLGATTTTPYDQGKYLLVVMTKVG